MKEEYNRFENLPIYHFKPLNQLKSKLEAEGKKIIDLGMGNPNLPPQNHVIETMVNCTIQAHTHCYSSSNCKAEMHKEICNYYKDYFNADLYFKKEVIVTRGIKDGFAHLMFGLLKKRDSVILPNPFYPPYVFGLHFDAANIINPRFCIVSF